MVSLGGGNVPVRKQIYKLYWCYTAYETILTDKGKKIKTFKLEDLVNVNSLINVTYITIEAAYSN